MSDDAVLTITAVVPAASPATPMPLDAVAAPAPAVDPAAAPEDEPSWVRHLLRSLLTLASFGPPHYMLRRSASLARQSHRARLAAVAAAHWTAAMQAHPGQSIAAGVKRATMMAHLMNGRSSDGQPNADEAAMEAQDRDSLSGSSSSLPESWIPNAEANEAFAAASAASAAAASASSASASVAATSSPATAAPADSASSSSAAAPSDGLELHLAAAQSSADAPAAIPQSQPDLCPSQQLQQFDHGYASSDGSYAPLHRSQHQHIHRNHNHHRPSSSPTAARRRRPRSRHCAECTLRGEEFGNPDPHSRHFSPSLLLPSTGSEMMHWIGRWVALPLSLMACQMIGGICVERAWEALAIRAAGGRPQPTQPLEILNSPSEPMKPAQAERIARIAQQL